MSIDSPLPPSTPISITGVSIHGTHYTQQDYIQRFLSQVQQAHSLQQLQYGLNQTLVDLHSTGIFKAVDLSVDRAHSTPATIATPLKVVVNVKEKNRLQLEVQANQQVTSGEQEVRVSSSLNNAFGRGERVTGSIAVGDVSSQSFRASLFKPDITNARHAVDIAAFSNISNAARLSSYHQHDRGVTMSLSNRTGRHTVGWEGIWRDVFPVQKPLTEDEQKMGITSAPSPSIVHLSGQSVKSSLTYTFTNDQRDNACTPTQGHYIQAQAEFAGLGGDVSFFKLSSDLKYFHPITPTLTWGISLLSGLIQPWQRSPLVIQPPPISSTQAPTSSPPPPPRTLISDRFFLGGQMTLRGFDTYSVGPADQSDAIGGDLFATLGTHVSWVLPFDFTRQNGIRGHVFINGGNLASLNGSTPTWSLIRNTIANARVAGGVGIIASTPVGRVEVNLSQALVHQPHDRVAPFQIGLGIKYA